MRAWCLLALLVVATSGCCSTHRAWLDGYSSCVPECGAVNAIPAAAYSAPVLSVQEEVTWLRLPKHEQL